MVLEVVSGRQSTLSSTNEHMSVAFIYVHTCIVTCIYTHHNTQVTFQVVLEVVSGRQTTLSSTNEHMSVTYIYVYTYMYSYIYSVNFIIILR